MVERPSREQEAAAQGVCETKDEDVKYVCVFAVWDDEEAEGEEQDVESGRG